MPSLLAEMVIRSECLLLLHRDILAEECQDRQHDPTHARFMIKLSDLPAAQKQLQVTTLPILLLLLEVDQQYTGDAFPCGGKHNSEYLFQTENRTESIEKKSEKQNKNDKLVIK